MISRPARSSSWARTTIGPRTAYWASRTAGATSSIRTAIPAGYARYGAGTKRPLELATPPRAVRPPWCSKEVAPAGLEPTAYGLGNRRSVQLSYGARNVGDISQAGAASGES